MKKKFFVAVAATVMTMASASMASAAVITDSVSTPAEPVTGNVWWEGGFSDYYKVSGNFDVTFELAIQGGDNQWNGAACVITTDADRADIKNGYKEYAVMRPDNFCWGDGNIGKLTNVTGWTAFTSSMKNGTATYNLKRVENHITVTMDFVGEDKAVYQTVYNVSDWFKDDLRIFLAADTATFTVKSYTVNTAPEEQDYSCKLNSTAYITDRTPLYTYTGDFTKTFRLENKSNGTNGWNNWVMIMKGIGTTSDASVDVPFRGDGWTDVAGVTHDVQFNQVALADSTIDAVVSRTGDVIKCTMNVKGANGQSYTHTATYDYSDMADTISFYFSGDNSELTVYEDTQTQADAPKMFAQYKKVADNNYTVRLIAEVEYDAAVNTTFKRIGFRCAKSATGVGDSYLGVNVYKTIMANGQQVTAEDGKYFAVLEITGVESAATLYVEPKYEDTSNTEVSLGNEVAVKMSDLIQ